MVPEAFLLRVVDKDTMQSIHEQSLQLLARAGVIFDNQTINCRFARKGQKVDGNRVYLSEALVSEALTLSPKSFTMVGRNNVAGVRIGANQETTVVAPGNGTLFIQNLEGRRRPATLSDFDNIAKLCENSRNVNLVGAIPVEPCDLSALSKPARLVHHLMRHSNKPLIGQAATSEEARQVFDIIEIAFGQRGYLDDRVAIAYGVNPASPLCFEPLTCETMVAYVQCREPGSHYLCPDDQSRHTRGLLRRHLYGEHEKFLCGHRITPERSGQYSRNPDGPRILWPSVTHHGRSNGCEAD